MGNVVNSKLYFKYEVPTMFLIKNPKSKWFFFFSTEKHFFHYLK